MLAGGMFSPLFKKPHVIVRVKGAGVTTDICPLASGHMATVNPGRLKFVEPIPHGGLHL